jgi:hypothetical protein
MKMGEKQQENRTRKKVNCLGKCEKKQERLLRKRKKFLMDEGACSNNFV